MDYAAEIEQIAAEARRRSAMLMDEVEEINRQTALRAEQFAIDAAERIRASTEPEPEPAPVENVEPQSVPPKPPPEIPHTPEVPPPFIPDPAMSPDEQRQAEIRAAVARARAARQARSTVAPSDGDFDSESEYYRRSTWLD
ncbi:hypothetical protein [Nocardia asteroides]|uniref:hypothetical protein n=1 Tax=Nocardia asteroides TaxID=1824 RepID=UPI001E4E29A4|nr:hypothetical protein [Nocardia asteroides]UGT53551.1 hypothetical protein LTT85_23050 [Nocardia asteroides]